MSSLQDILSTISGLAITFFVPAVVWITLSAGVYQLVRDGVRRIRLASQSSQRLAQKTGALAPTQLQVD